MKAGRLLSPGIACALLATVSVAASATPLRSAPLRDVAAGPCAPGAVYNPACDANQDGQITVTDIQLTAGHWNQAGTWVSDNNHTHLGQTWVANDNPLRIDGSVSAYPWASLVLTNTNASGDGLTVSSAGDRGVVVLSAGGSGVAVDTAGGNGMYVNSAGGNGVAVYSASYAGVYVYSAGNDGVDVTGTQYAGAFYGNIYVAGNSSAACRRILPSTLEIMRLSQAPW